MVIFNILNYQRVDPHQDSIDMWKTRVWLNTMRTNPQHDHPGNMFINCSLRGMATATDQDVVTWARGPFYGKITTCSVIWVGKATRKYHPISVEKSSTFHWAILMGLSKHRVPKNQMMSSFRFFDKILPMIVLTSPQVMVGQKSP